MNLKEGIGTQVRPRKHSTLNHAQEQVLESEVWFRERNQGRRKTLQSLPAKNNRPATSQYPKPINANRTKYLLLNNIQKHSKPLQHRLHLFCRYCKNIGQLNHQTKWTNSSYKTWTESILGKAKSSRDIGHRVSAISGRIYWTREKLHESRRLAHLLVDTWDSLNLIKEKILVEHQPRQQMITTFTMVS